MNFFSFNSNHSPIIFERYCKSQSAAQRARGSSKKKSDKWREIGLKNKRDGVAPFIWVPPSIFRKVLTYAMLRCHWEKSAFHVFLENSEFYHAEKDAIWSIVGGSSERRKLQQVSTAHNSREPIDPTKRTAWSPVQNNLVLKNMLALVAYQTRCENDFSFLPGEQDFACVFSKFHLLIVQFTRNPFSHILNLFHRT